MRYSNLFGKTLRDKPRNADSSSHQLLLRAGFVRPVAGGAAFGLLPLGARALANIERVVTEELDCCGVQSLIAPGGNKSASGESSRQLAFRRRDTGRGLPFAEQHESLLGMLAGNLNLSYRDVPLLLASGRWFTREQSRPNLGLLSAPEFQFRAVYAFCAGDSGPQRDCLRNALTRALNRVGVVSPLLESSDHTTQELVINTETVGRPVLACDHCSYQADVENAESRVPEWPHHAGSGPMRAVHGPGLITVGPLADFLGIPVYQTTKTLLFQADERVLAVCVAGVYDVSEAKLAKVLGCRHLALAGADAVRELTASEVGYAGPIRLPPAVEVLWDLSTQHRTNFEAGANRTDYHLININFGVDVAPPSRFVDIRVSREGEACLQCGQGALVARKVITMGHVSSCDAGYADLLSATYLDSDRTTKPLTIDCAGLDLTCVLAAIVEQNHDARGIVWPGTVAPFAVHLVSLPPSEAFAADLYRRLKDKGVEVLWDDRSDSAGVKFGDADLIGIPVRLVVSKRTGEQVEWKRRSEEQGELLSPEDVLARLAG